jgi:hypothetical protein
MLPAVYFYKDFIDIAGIAESAMSSLQLSGVNGSEFDAPEPDRFPSDGCTSFSQEVFNITVAEIENVIEPDCIGYDIWRESVPLIGIHEPILAISAH